MDERTVDVASDRPAADVVADIAGHPAEAPSLRELEYLNPPLDRDEIRRILDELIEAGIIRKLDGHQHSIFQLKEDARERFNSKSLFSREAWRREYESVLKPAEIKEIESIQRPSSD